MMDQINTQVEMLPAVIRYWVNWMGIIFLISVIFVWKKKSAQFVLLSMVLTIPVALGVFYWTETIHLLGVAHILVWVPLFYYLAKYEMKSESFSFKSIYGIWLCLLMTTISISLVFDVRDIALVITGNK